jgi:hypothetical protein
MYSEIASRINAPVTNPTEILKTTLAKIHSPPVRGYTLDKLNTSVYHHEQQGSPKMVDQNAQKRRTPEGARLLIVAGASFS